MSSVGSVYVDVLPNAAGFSDRLRSDISPQADALGQQIGRALADRIAAGIRDGIGNGFRGGSGDAARGGSESGGAFADAFKAKVSAALKALPKVDITADSSDADRKIAELRAKLQELSDKKIGVDVDAATARAELDKIKAALTDLGARSPDIRVRTDTARASAELAAFNAELDKIDGKEVKPDTSSGVQGFNLLIAAAVGLGPALIPVAAAAVASLASVAAAATAAGAAAGVAFAALKPVFGAVSALNAQSNVDPAQAAQQARSQANAIASANATVASSEASLANARASAASGAVTAANAISNAQASAASGAINAARAVSDAQRSAAQGVATAEQGVTSAEQTLTAAQQAARSAQQSLTDARKAAAQQLQDYKNQLADGALAQRAATLAIAQAKQTLDATNTNPASTTLQREQAQLAYDQALQQNVDLGVQQERLRAAAAAAAKAGVDGSKQVVTAQQGVATSNQAVANSQTALGRAQAAVVEAQRKGAEQVATAQKAQADQARTSAASISAAQASQANQARTSAASITAAQQGVANAQRGLATAYAQTGTAGATSAFAVKQAFEGLTPVGADFARFIFSLKDSFGGLSKAAQNGLLPGLQTFIQSLLPFLPQITAFVGNLATVMGDLFVSASKALTGPFFKQFFAFLDRETPKWLVTFAGTIGNITTGLAGLFQALAPVGDTLNGSILSGTKAFADWATSLGKNTGFQTFLQYLKDSLPKVGAFFGALFSVAGLLIQALAPLGPVILDIVTAALKFIASLSPDKLLLIVGAVAAVVAIFGGPFIAIIVAVVALGAEIVHLWQTSQTFRTIVTTAFTAVRDIVVSVWENYIRPALTALWSFLQTQIFPTVLKLWREVVQPAFAQIGQIIATTWNVIILPVLKAWWFYISNVLAPVFLFLLNKVVGPIFRGIGDVIVFVWQKVISPTLSLLNSAIGGLGAVFQGALSVIQSIWNGLGAVIKGPINAVLSFIQTYFIKPINDMLGAIGLGDSIKLPTIYTAPLAGASPNNSSSRVSAHADGGTIPGHSPHDRADNILIRATAGEFMLPVVATNLIRSQYGDGALESLRRGRIPGHADGGLIGSIGSAIGSAASSVNDFSGSLRDSIINGADFAAKVATDPGSAIHDLISNLVGKLSSSPFAQAAGSAVAKVGDGLITQITGAFAQQNQQAAGGPLVQGVPGSASASAAVQYALEQISSGAGGWLDRCLAFVNAAWGHQVPWLGTPRAIDAWNAAPGKHPGDVHPPAGAALFYDHLGPAGHVDLSLGGNTIASTDIPTSGRVGLDNFNDPMTRWGAHYLGWALPGGTGQGVLAGNSNIPLGSGVSRWSNTVLQALNLVGQPSSLLATVLRRMNQESGGNPRAINLTDTNAQHGTPSKGLLQVIDPTFAAYRNRSLSGDIYDPLANVVASMDYAIGRYGSLSAAYDRAGGYADGGVIGSGYNKPLLFDSGGMLPMGTSLVQNNTGAPEPLIRGDQGGNVQHFHIQPTDPYAVAAESARIAAFAGV